MVTALAIPDHTIAQDFRPDTTWMNYFNVFQALATVSDHVDGLPSSLNPERHTARAYGPALKYFLDWSQNALPTADLVKAYVAHLKSGRGLKSTTIGSKYMSVLRHYLQALANQTITGFKGDERDYITDCRDAIRAAYDSATAPPPDVTSNEPALYQHGTRLSRAQVETVYYSIERSTIKGRRDLALLYLGLTTGLRLAELQRLTLAHFEPFEDHYLVRVRGKRNNYDPVPVDHDAMMLIQRYIAVYNADLPDDDPRRIDEHTPLWQPLLHGDHHAYVGVNGYDPAKGLSQQAIRDTIALRVQAAIGKPIAPHDMRRTVAYIARKEGMEMEGIQKLLRHKSVATTARYVGDVTTYDARLLSRRKRFEGIRDDVQL